MPTREYYNGSIESTSVEIELRSPSEALSLGITEGAVTGSIAVEVRIPGNTEYSAPSDNSVTLGSRNSLTINRGQCVFDAVKLAPDTLSGPVNYFLVVWGE